MSVSNSQDSFQMHDYQLFINNEFAAQFPIHSKGQKIAEDRQNPVQKKAHDDDNPKEQINRPAFPFSEELIARTEKFFPRTDALSYAPAL